MAYIDELFGPNHRTEKHKLIKSLCKVTGNWELAEDAVSDEILSQLKRYSEGKTLPSPPNLEEYRYHKYIIYNNAKRRFIKKLKRNSYKNTDYDLNDKKSQSVEGISENTIYDNQQAWEVLIDGKRLLSELYKFNIKHPRRGEYKEIDIQIWADYEKLEHSYEDIQSKFEISYDTAKQAVSKVKWGIEELIKAKENAGERGMYFIAIENKFPKQLKYLQRKFEEEIIFFEKVLNIFSNAIEDSSDVSYTLGTLDKVIEDLTVNNILIFDRKVTDIIIATLFLFESKQDLTDEQLKTLIKKAEVYFDNNNKMK